MRKYLRIYKCCIYAQFAALAAYRFNFILDGFIMLLSNVLMPLVTILIYNSGSSFPDWSFHEALLIQAIFIIGSGLSAMFANGIVWNTMSHVVQGTFDLVLTKPVNALFLSTANTFELPGISQVLGGIALLVYSLIHLPTPTFLMWLQFLLLMFMGLIVSYGINVIMASTTFKWVGNSRVREIIDSINSFGRYPISIFPKYVSNIISFIIPVAMIAFFPASALLGRFNPYMLIAIIPCLIFTVFGILLFELSLKGYKSAGG